jgi:hypothetical protein
MILMPSKNEGMRFGTDMKAYKACTVLHNGKFISSWVRDPDVRLIYEVGRVIFPRVPGSYIFVVPEMSDADAFLFDAVRGYDYHYGVVLEGIVGDDAFWLNNHIPLYLGPEAHPYYVYNHWQNHPLEELIRSEEEPCVVPIILADWFKPTKIVRAVDYQKGDVSIREIEDHINQYA